MLYIRQVVDRLSGKLLAHHEDGEIFVRGPQIMKSGYLKYNANQRNVIDNEGWLRTGECNSCLTASLIIKLASEKNLISSEVRCNMISTEAYLTILTSCN